MNDHDKRKKNWEKRIAEIFITEWNHRFHFCYELAALQENPDVIFRNRNGESLGIEITILEDNPGQIPYFLGKNKKKKLVVSQTTGMTSNSSFEDTLSLLRKRLAEKSLCKYYSQTALVLYQFSPIWDQRDWGFHQQAIQALPELAKIANSYRAGVWVITPEDANQAGYCLVCLQEPDLGLDSLF
jgi:hypothetical protein